MSIDHKKTSPGHDGSAGTLAVAAMGMESEFSVMVDGRPARPEDVFGDPTAFIRQPLMHRTGTSYHLPTGGAVYFDTGVIEVATPVIEIERGCAARAGRNLWESILFLRRELDAWERRTGREVRLVGFSTHYNVSFELPRSQQGRGRTVQKLALLLSHLLPVPVMMLAANRRSTGIGVRPRGDRIEVTADFTPSASLMIATATLIVGIVREVMTWPSFELDMLDRKGIPQIRDFAPIPHTSRKGWLAKNVCFAHSPFEVDVDEAMWEVKDGQRMSLRGMAGRIVKHFWHPIRRISDPWTFRLIGSVMRGRAPSLLDLHDRPPEYEDVGRLCTWDNLFPERELSRSRYERVLIRAISGQKLTLDGRSYTPTGCAGGGTSSSAARATTAVTSSASTTWSGTSRTGSSHPPAAADRPLSASQSAPY
jgi:hypothetical protein